MADKKPTPKDKANNVIFTEIFLDKLIIGCLYIISLMPLGILYILSDIINIIMHYIIRYRRTVILDNIKNAFPEKTDKEIKKIVAKFYRHFTDLIVETIKLHSINPKKLDKRITFEGLGLIEEYYNQNKSIIILAMHHNNWEWCSFVQTKGKHLGLMIYSPVRNNKSVEEFLLYSRERWGGKCIPVNKSARLALQFHRNRIPTALWLGADQTSPANSSFWTIFLNREAPFFSGPEKIAAKTNQPVFFQHVQKTGRGRYVFNFIPLIKNPEDYEPKEILLTYIRTMENIIKQEPEYYLWSHRRWKHKRPSDVPLTI